MNSFLRHVCRILKRLGSTSERFGSPCNTDKLPDVEVCELVHGSLKIVKRDCLSRGVKVRVSYLVSPARRSITRSEYFEVHQSVRRIAGCR